MATTTVEQNVIERRKDKRFVFRGNAFAFNAVDFGRIIDISMGGIAIHSGSESEWENRFEDFYIVVAGQEFSFQGARIKKISSSIPFYEKPLAATTACRCSLMFESLQDSQKSRLEDIIRKYTIDERDALQ